MNALRDRSAEEQNEFSAHPLKVEMRLLFFSALVVFTITVLIGLLNGQRVVKLSQDVLLTHVHAGTIGWITLSVFALSLWLFGGNVSGSTPFLRWTSIFAAVAVPLYILAFLSGNFIARAIFGVPALAVMLVFFLWIAARTRKVRLGVAHLALLASLLTLCLGALLGVLLQFEFATQHTFLPDGAFAAHPATLVSGYLVLIGMALNEWRLRPASAKLSRWGVAQITLLFLAGLAIGNGLLLNVTPLLALNTLLVLVGTIIYIVRFLPRVVRFSWLAHNSERFFAVSGIFIVVNVTLTVYLVVSLISGAFPNGNPPSGLLIALDHATFIGVMTNGLFGLIREATEQRRSFWPWSEDVLFWGMNIGVSGFLVSLIADIPVLERIFTPIMGLSILLAIVVYIIRFLPGRPAAQSASQSAANQSAD